MENISIFKMLGDDTIMAKGNNQYGQLGLGDNIDRDEFVAVEIEDVKWVMSSGDHSFLIKNDGSIWSCGRNDVGQLGLGDTENRNVFSDVGVVINDHDMLSCAGHSTEILKEDDTVLVCGLDDYREGALEANLNARSASEVNGIMTVFMEKAEAILLNLE